MEKTRLEEGPNKLISDVGREPSWNVPANVWDLSEPGEREALNPNSDFLRLKDPCCCSEINGATGFFFTPISSLIICHDLKMRFFFLSGNNRFSRKVGFMCMGY